MSPVSAAARRAPAVLLVPATAAAVVALLPLGYLAVRATEGGPGTAAEVLLRDRTVPLVVRSLLLAGVVTAGSALLGIGTGIKGGVRSNALLRSGEKIFRETILRAYDEGLARHVADLDEFLDLAMRQTVAARAMDAGALADATTARWSDGSRSSSRPSRSWTRTASTCRR